MASLLDDPLGYWEQRHAGLGPWRSGGDRGLSNEENYEFYAIRVGKLVELIRRHLGRGRGLRLLDAGCGWGHFTDALRKCGHRAIGIDGSANAIDKARETYGAAGFVEATLDRYRPDAVFDGVVCIDVLFHVLDDALWKAALQAFGRYASAEGTLIITDIFPAERYTPHPHIVHRTAHEYGDVLAPLGFQLVEQAPYAFGANPIQFAVYRRLI